MKWSKFFLGIAAGAAAGYLVTKRKDAQRVKPEKVIRMIRHRFKDKMKVTGSWIHVEPKREIIRDIEYNIYQGGFTGIINGEPQLFEFKVDADTGSFLSLNE
jgi:predicted small secreted protein